MFGTFNNVVQYNGSPQTVQPYVYPYNSTNVVWPAGMNAGTDVSGTIPYIIGTVSPSVVPATATPDWTISLKSILNLPWRMPANTYRIIAVTEVGAGVDAQGWDNFSIQALYRNPYGAYLKTPVLPLTQKLNPPDGTNANVNNWIGKPFGASPAFQQWYYISELVDVTLLYTPLTPPTVPYPPGIELCFSFWSEGMALFNLQDSTRYMSSTLQVLAQPPTGSTVLYSAYGDIYPVIANQLQTNLPLPFTSDLFYPWNSIETPMTGDEALFPNYFPLMCLGEVWSAEFLLDPTATRMNDSAASSILAIPTALGNARVFVKEDNNTDLFISLIQNGIAR